MSLTGKNLQEINRYRDARFPLGIYIVTRDSIYPEGRGYMDLHWHEELQFTLVREGSIRMTVNGVSSHLSAGEAIFINKDALHITDYMTDDAVYISLDVPERILGFWPSSRMEQNYVLPYTDDPFFTSFTIRGACEWEKEWLILLGDICDRFLKEPAEFFEYEVSTRVVALWLLLIRNADLSSHADISRAFAYRKQQRLQKMLSYIHSNYQNKLLVKNIAAAGSVSEAECNRCFNEVVGMTPTQYLLKCRYLRSRELLIATNMSITDIALAVGFNDVSYFIQCFSKQAGMTPREFRRSSN